MLATALLLLQLEDYDGLVRRLRERGAELAIGMEFFQQPFQDSLDAYIAGTLSEEDLLRETEYFERWRFDYRLYRPILRYAKEHGIDVVVAEPHKRKPNIRAGGYGENFATSRKGPWTH